MKHITKEERKPPSLPQSSCFSKYTYGAYPFSSLYFSRRLLFSRAISSPFSRAATHRLVRLAIEGGKRTLEGSWGRVSEERGRLFAFHALLSHILNPSSGRPANNRKTLTSTSERSLKDRDAILFFCRVNDPVSPSYSIDFTDFKSEDNSLASPSRISHPRFISSRFIPLPFSPTARNDH